MSIFKRHDRDVFGGYIMCELDKLFFENGIIMDLDDKDEPLEMDSLAFASLMISIEEFYNIIVPTDMLLYEKWATISLIEKNITDLKESK